MNAVPITDDELIRAAKSVIAAKEANCSLLQGKLGVGFAKANQLLDELEKYGIVTAVQTVTKRDVVAATPEEAVGSIMATRNIRDGKELFEKL